MLRPDTAKLWDFLRDDRALSGFVLVGGTALSMHLDHRISEDLDLMFLGKQLPKGRIDALKRRAWAAGFEFNANDSPEVVAEFEDTGMDYRDFQQDYVVNGTVKVTFVAPDAENSRQLEHVESPGPRVASMEEIFRLKCIVAADRSKTRDWFDLYLLLKEGRFKPADMLATFQRGGVPSKYDIAIRRLSEGRPSLNDEGYETLLPNAPSVEQMREFFIAVRDHNEIEIAVMDDVVQRVNSAPTDPKTEPGIASTGSAKKRRRP